jgi:hypothetical protein
VNADCLKLTTYFAEHDKTGRRFLADALLDPSLSASGEAASW